MPPSQDILIYSAIAFVPSSPLWIIAWCGWTGRYRRWARMPRPVAVEGVAIFHRRNYLPFILGTCAFFWTSLWIIMALEDFVPAFEPLVLPSIMTVGGITIVLSIWWPEFLRPTWHKDWVARGGDEDPSYELLWSPEEHRRFAERRAARRATATQEDPEKAEKKAPR